MFKNKKINIAVVIVMILTLVFSTMAVSFGTSDEAKKKAAEAREAGKKAAAATASLEEAEKKLEQISEDIEATKASIEQSKKDIEKQEKEIDKQEGDLNDRLTAMYKTGTVGYIDVILSSEGVTDLISNLGMVQKVLENDQDLLKGLEKKLKKLQEMKDDLEEQEAELEVQEAETKALKDKFQKEADAWAAKEAELQRQSEALAREAAANQGGAEQKIIDNGGNISPTGYCWPTKSNYIITSNYGYRICPFHGKEFHDGLDICLTSGTNGSPVYAINDGVITRASWYSGYGNCITLSCGGGISALYGHLSGYNCSNGQYVKKGQVIGYIGSTGNSTGPHLHFMVFKNGSVMSPWSIY